MKHVKPSALGTMSVRFPFGNRVPATEVPSRDLPCAVRREAREGRQLQVASEFMTCAFALPASL